MISIDDARTNGRRVVQETLEGALWKRNEEFSMELINNEAMISIDDARTNGRRVVQETLEGALWKRNEEFSMELINIINEHRFSHHPIYQTNHSPFRDHRSEKIFYQEYGQLMEVVTHGVIHALNACTQLQSRLGTKAVYGARFLLQINLLDELGFRTGQTRSRCYAGHPYLSHFMQYAESMSQIGISVQELETHRLTDECGAFCRCFTNNYGDYARLICVLALFDKVFADTISEWSIEVAKSSGLDVSQGYYSIGVGGNDATDTWYLFRQAITPEHYQEMRVLTLETLETWAVWLDRLLTLSC